MDDFTERTDKLFDEIIACIVKVQKDLAELQKRLAEEEDKAEAAAEGFECVVVPYGLSFFELESRLCIRWDPGINEDKFKPRLFESRGETEVLMKLVAPKRLIWSLEAVFELEDMGCSCATIHEGVAWAMKHPPSEFPVGTSIPLLVATAQGKVVQDSMLIIPMLSNDGEGRWEIRSRYFSDHEGWNESDQFLGVRRSFK